MIPIKNETHLDHEHIVTLLFENLSHNCFSSNFAPHKTIGTPVPGCTEAPTKYKFSNNLHFILGLNHKT